MSELPEPWATAQLYLESCGEGAEDEIRRLADELMAEGRVEDTEKLFEVFQALVELRKTARRFDEPLH